MARKKKLTAAQRRAKRERKKNFMMVFIRGKQKWVRRPPTVDGIPVDEFIRRNADPIWLHQNEMWEYMTPPGEGDLEEYMTHPDENEMYAWLRSGLGEYITLSNEGEIDRWLRSSLG